MSDKTKIEWTGATWNVVTGCAKVSQGCKNCYALRDWPRLAANPKTVYFGREFTDVRCHPERLEIPMRWTRPRKIFVNAMSDLFHEDVPDEFIDRVFAVMGWAQHHTFQVLTKRPERMLAYLGDSDRIKQVAAARARVPYCSAEWTRQWPLPNVWLGVSVEDQASADERIPLLLQTPAAVRWISAEPLLGPINLTAVHYGDRFYVNTLAAQNTEGVIVQPGLDWVVAGGESGPQARPMHPDWARSMRDQCKAAGVAFHFKQWGEWEIASTANEHYDSNMETNKAVWVHTDGVTTKPSFFRTDGGNKEKAYAMIRVGKKRAGRLLDGVQHDGYPR